MNNFGIQYYDQVTELGINCKMNEFQAAMGLCVLDDLEEIIQKREKVYSIYKNAFQNINKVALQKLNKDWTQNYSYFPILFESENKLLEIKEKLNKQEIFPRRYFYPSLESLPYLKIKQEVDISTSVSKRILCLPLFESLDLNIQNQIINIILTNL
jgi:dTDP-4-amino-4,6-dideoxygalactose transaminase